ncbi:MAG: DUF502 domain-containing protein [Verrucomicrobiales bacterium]
MEQSIDRTVHRSVGTPVRRRKSGRNWLLVRRHSSYADAAFFGFRIRRDLPLSEDMEGHTILKLLTHDSMKDPEKPKFHFFRTIFSGGLLFLVPLGVLIMVVAKPLAFAQKIVAPLTDRLPFESLIGLETPVLAALLFLILCCFLVGLYAQTPFAKGTVKKAEAAVLSKVPGYGLLKDMSEDLVGFENSDSYPVVILTMDGVGQIALLIEEGDDDMVTVFVPDAPSPRSGGVFFLKRELITPVDMSLPTAMTCLKRFGEGSAEFRRLTDEASEGSG